jgi:MYXO-CTERM domain-containing protein
MRLVAALFFASAGAAAAGTYETVAVDSYEALRADFLALGGAMTPPAGTGLVVNPGTASPYRGGEQFNTPYASAATSDGRFAFVTDNLPFIADVPNVRAAVLDATTGQFETLSDYLMDRLQSSAAADFVNEGSVVLGANDDGSVIFGTVHTGYISRETVRYFLATNGLAATGGPQPTPEPAGWMIGALALAALAMRRRA